MYNDFNNNIRNKDNFANYCIEKRIKLFNNNRQNQNDDKNVLINNFFVFFFVLYLPKSNLYN